MIFYVLEFSWSTQMIKQNRYLYWATPTCDDGILNQNETAIDCGGPCTACGNIFFNWSALDVAVFFFFTIACSRKSHKYGYNIWSQTCMFLKWNVFLEIVYFFLKLVLSKGQLLRNSKILLKCSIMLKCHWCVLINLTIIITYFCDRTITKIESDSTQNFSLTT
jgi:hypothetical protein